jgi:outer membrane immunogenic protein
LPKRSLAYKAAPVASDPWNGFYAGINVGGGITQSKATDTEALVGTVPPVIGADNFTHAADGALVGGQVGWNWHFAPVWVAGVEADWDWSGQSEQVCVSACFPAAPTGFLTGVQDHLSIDQIATARARLGWIAPNNSLWYATGGLAAGRIEHSEALPSVPPYYVAGTTAVASFGHDQVGWVIGGGVETPLWNKWSVKVEYLFVDLGGVTESSSALVGPGIIPPLGGVQTATSSYSLHDNIVRAGLNYNFTAGSQPTGAYPVKYQSTPSATSGAKWNGFYAGLNAGSGLARNRTTESLVDPGNQYPALSAESFNHAPLGAIGGGQVGWNWRLQQALVAGVEADWQWSGQSNTSCTTQCISPAVLGAGILGGLTDEQSIKWLGTARARLGWLTPDDSLLYVTGGAAWGHVDQTLTAYAGTGFFTAGTVSAASFSQDRAGWTIGAGVESPVWNNWSLKAEYLYIDLGTVTNSFTSAIVAFPPLNPATVQINTSTSHIQDNVVRVGANYNFN